jgi:hypothetical protein
MGMDVVVSPIMHIPFSMVRSHQRKRKVKQHQHTKPITIRPFDFPPSEQTREAHTPFLLTHSHPYLPLHPSIQLAPPLVEMPPLLPRGPIKPTRQTSSTEQSIRPIHSHRSCETTTRETSATYSRLSSAPYPSHPPTIPSRSIVPASHDLDPKTKEWSGRLRSLAPMGARNATGSRKQIKDPTASLAGVDVRHHARLL